MNPENSIWTGNTLEQDVPATHSGSGDPALEVGNPSHPLALSHNTRSVVCESKSTNRPHYFYKDKQISDMVDQWRGSPHDFLGMQPGKNVGCWLHENIGSLPEIYSIDRHPVDVVKRRVYMFHYHRLRDEFGELFHGPGKTDPLCLFLQHSYMPQSDTEQKLLKKNHLARVLGGRRYDDLATATKHPGVIFLLTTFSSTHIESKNHDPRVLSAAVESIARLGEMEEYDEAAGTIHDVLSGFWANWLNSIKHSLSCRMPVLDLFSNDEIAEFIYPRLPCHSPNGRLLSTGTATSAVLEHTHLVQETVVTALEPIVTAEDKDGIEREFDLRNLQRALVYVEDTSGQGRYIQAPTLADLLSNYGAGMQFQSLYTVSPAITMPSEATFPLDTFATQEALWPS
ncbi:hypothetical protein CEP51_016366 [Fusarium floridanum]|uniref:Uncharacterized protein n=1 Tax=Fusarium floridanum TaxID=1325733 RepID=A0A428NRH6_9HYPO|nr:hypothetical protein CEP51_016366 [Fusarium floridanum]